jgi:SAM-dependent methyltransferase/DNA-directed RNA polymerase subunit RPC12/RpoP
MREILDHLSADALVLDLACATGSFDASGYSFRTIRLDIERRSGRGFVQADACRLPFAASRFDAVISNHGLEHIADWKEALREIKRVLKPDGALYLSVPDASTLTDKLYRWLASGGGHVNAFTSARELANDVSELTGLVHVATRTLCTSLSFLNRRNAPKPIPKKLELLGGGREWTLVAWSQFARRADRVAGTRWAVYGWAFYFGRVGASVETETATNVCARCGAGHPSEWLLKQSRVDGRYYSCPSCGGRNWFSEDHGFRYGSILDS